MLLAVIMMFISATLHTDKEKGVAVKNRSFFLPTTPGRASKEWSTTETENLLKGVKQFGVGKWAQILNRYEFASHRTTTSLKDKWRNLQGRRPK